MEIPDESISDLSLVASNPKNNTTLKADHNIELLFDRTVIPGIGGIVFSNGVDKRTISINDPNQVTFNLSEVIINPVEDFQTDETYTVSLADGAIRSADGRHHYSGFKDATVTILPPNPVLTFSSLNSERIVVDDDLIFIFDEKVVAGNGNIIISNGTDTRTIAATDDNQVRFSSNAVIINPIEDLAPNTTYTIQIENDAIIDLMGHAYAGFSDGKITPVSSAPLIISSNLRNDLALVIDQDIVLGFNESVRKGQGNIVLSNGLDIRTIAIDDTRQVNLDNTSFVLTINPSVNLIADTAYTIQLDEGIVTDTAGHTFPGVSDMMFSTISPGPLLRNRLFEDDSTIQNDDDIVLFFDKEIQASSGNIVLTSEADTRVIDVHDASQVSISTILTSPKSGHKEFVMQINPDQDLIADTIYTVQIDKGAVTDISGREFSGLGNKVITTTTSEPRLRESNPVEGSVIKPDGFIRLWFDEGVIAGAGDIILSNGSDTRVIGIHDANQINFEFSRVTINPTHDLIEGNYSVQIASGVITDEKGNAYPGLDNATITAVNSNPLLVTSDPVEGSIVKTDQTITLRFDENVMVGSGEIIFNNGSDTRVIAVDDASQVTFSGSNVFINLSKDLVDSTTYTVQMNAGAIVDRAGNPYAGFSDTMITATEAPQLLHFLYENSNSNPNSVPIHDTIILEFDEEIVPGSGDIILTSGTDVRAIEINDTSQIEINNNNRTSSLDGNMTVEINLAQDLEAGATYQILMASGVVLDTDGNPYSGVNAADMLEFTTEEYVTLDPFAPLF